MLILWEQFNMHTRASLIKQTNKINRVVVGFDKDPYKQQHKVFRKLIKKAEDTEFGLKYQFDEILSANFDMALYRKLVPIHTYETIYESWWKRTKRGDKDTVWPGKIKYFALSSGTTQGSSKFIPVSKQMLKTIRKTSFKQIVALMGMRLPAKTLSGEVLMIGGCTKLEDKNGKYFGDMSGISAAHAMPNWFVKSYYKPGYAIAEIPEWNKRVDAIVKHAKDWDISIICGMPNWVHLVLEKIIAHYKVKSIHEIWPNFKLFIHGGVYFDIYKSAFSQLLSKDIKYAETYMASEGFFGFTTADSKGQIRLVLNGNVFYEFIPFNSHNFDELGKLKPNVNAITLEQVKADVDYALVITNNSGAWRYLIGDTIQFVDIKKTTIKITGRLSHSLNVCGEHVSAGNLVGAFSKTFHSLDLPGNEFTVAAKFNNGRGCYHVFIAGNKAIGKLPIVERLDKYLKAGNTDYAVARTANLGKPIVHIVPKKTMYLWLIKNGKEGNQFKMPLVLNKQNLEDWLAFVGIDI